MSLIWKRSYSARLPIFHTAKRKSRPAARLPGSRAICGSSFSSLFGPGRAKSEPKRYAERRPAEAEILKQLVVALVVEEMAIGEDGVAPLEAVRDPHHALPGEAG